MNKVQKIRTFLSGNSEYMLNVIRIILSTLSTIMFINHIIVMSSENWDIMHPLSENHTLWATFGIISLINFIAYVIMTVISASVICNKIINERHNDVIKISGDDVTALYINSIWTFPLINWLNKKETNDEKG